MSKYQPLSDRLSRHDGDEYSPTFAELEEVLGFPLPKGARTGKTWWANDGDKAQSRAWAAHGWEVGDIDHAAERVVFRRGAASAVALQTGMSAAAAEPSAEPPAQTKAPAQPEPPAQPEHPTRAEPQAAPEPVMSEGPGTALVPTAPPPRPAAGRKLGLAAAMVGGVAVAAGLTVLAARALLAPKKQPPFPPLRRWKR